MNRISSRFEFLAVHPNQSKTLTTDQKCILTFFSIFKNMSFFPRPCHVLSTGFVNRFCQQILLTGLVNKFYQTCFVNRFCQQVMSTGFVNRFCQHVSIYLHFEQNFHKPGNQRQQQEQQRYV